MVESVVQSHAEIVVGSGEKKLIRVLHVDDELGLLKVAKQCLELQGPFQVDTTGSVEEALNKLKEREYDAVVSDYVMPGKDGIDFLKELRDAGNDIPFIMFTGKGKEEIAIRALNLGADGYFCKIGSPETVYGELAHSICQMVESKKAEEALRTNESYLRAILDSMFTGLIVIDEKTHKIVDANFHALETIDAPREDVIGRICHKFICPAEEGKCPITDLGQTVDRSERVLLRADGQRIPILKTVTTIIRRGRKYLIESFVDITERKKTEEVLQKSEEKYAKLFDGAMDAIFVTDAETGILVDCNRAASELVCRERSELIGKHQRILHLPEEIKGGFNASFKQHLKEREGQVLETRVITKNGEIKDVAIKANLFELQGRKMLQGIFRDITESKKAKESLRACGERFEKLFESQMVGVMISDSEGKVSSANPTAAKTLGYSSPKELVGLVVADLLVDHKQRETLFEQLMGEGFVRNFEIALKRKDDAQVCVRANVMLYKDEKGDVLRTECVFTEFSEHERVKEELKDLREKMDVLFEHAPDAYYLNDLRGKFIAGNKAAEEMTGYSKTELIGKSFLNLKLLTRSQIPKAAKLLAMNALGKPTGPDEFTLNRKDGTQVQVEIRTFPSKIKNRALVLGIARDVTERNRNEKMIIESQQKFEGLFTGNPEATAHLNQDFHILDANPRFMSLFGYSFEEIKGKHIDDVIVPKNLIEEAEMLDKKAVDGYVYHDTVRAKKDGSLVAVSISAAPILIQGQLAGYIGVYKDISELKKTEHQSAMMNEKLRVVGGLTRHDVRNKLSAIAGNVYLLKKQLADNKEVLDKIRDMETAVSQVTRIFDFAKDYEMLGVEELTYIDVQKSVNEAVLLFQDLKGVRVLNECHGLTVLSDSLLRQLFYNLIDNSLKYGKKLSQIRIHYEKAEENRLRLVYEDDGVGIALDAKPKIFGEGYTTGKGSGYGLYLVKRLMDVYGWTIQETGTPGKGVRFTMVIPEKNQNGKENYQLH
jgi:PAS domain S-box-containing protein